jgi:hypothetical protein
MFCLFAAECEFMGKVTKWTTEYPIDFEMIGIVSPMKEYKLGWHLNEIGLFQLSKGDDIEITFADESVVSISNLRFEIEFTSIHLLRNKLLKKNAKGIQYLLPELQQFDYLLKIKNSIEEDWSRLVLAKLKECSAVVYCAELDINKIKAKENLMF